MSENTFNQVMTQLQTQLKTININNGFNNTIDSNNVVIGYTSPDNIHSYPFISVGYIGQEDDIQTDQLSYEVSLLVEIFGYVESSNPLVEANNLLADIKKAIRDDENLGSLRVWGLQLKTESSSYNRQGICRVELRCKIVEENT